MMRNLRLALGFLTTIPVRPSDGLNPGDLGRSAGWYALIGLALGGLLWLFNYFLSTVFPSILLSAILLAIWVLVSGALHLDGWADCCDGMFVFATKERRLEILRDTHLGAFGAVGLTILLMLKWAAVVSIESPIALLLAPTLGRGFMPLLAMMKPARSDGLGATLHQEVKWTANLPLLLVLPLAYLSIPRGLIAVAASLVASLAWGRFARSRLGGITGDVLGASCELIELVVLLTFAWS